MPVDSQDKNKKTPINVTALLVHTLLKILIVVILTVSLTATAMGFVSYNSIRAMRALVDMESIYPNILINGVDVGNLGKSEAARKVRAAFKRDLDTKAIGVRINDIEYYYKFEEFGASYDFSAAVEQAYNYGRDGTLEQRYDIITALSETPYNITYEPLYTYDDSTVEEKLSILAEQAYVAPVNAIIERANGTFVITKEVSGKALDVVNTAESVKNLLAADTQGVTDAFMTVLEAPVKESDVAKATSLIGTFHTSFTPGATGRNTNIRNAAGKINDSSIQPGEVFSTNAALGDQTIANGYAVAPVIIGNKTEDGVGGGVCQVSSTLYNAVLYAELEVVERTNHSLKVGYLDYGFDATLAGDYLDLKFRNNTSLPIFLECYTDGGRLTVNIYGEEIHDTGRALRFYNELIETIRPGADIITYDRSLSQGTRIVSSSAKTGLKYALYKTVYQDGVEISNGQINVSRYKAVPAQVRVGSRPVAPEPDPAVADPADPVDYETEQ
ncbi:MAG: VanW family protein [Clostridiales bacterium]|jgi:vancomycin resistance protein YoaR|nr:VanW family protein [Clostridiales bacterium]